MNYLMYCESDRSYSVVSKTELVHDETQKLAIGEKLIFFWRNEQFDGEIKLISDDRDYLRSEAILLRKEESKQPTISKTESPLRKRQSIKRKIFNPIADLKQIKKKRKRDYLKQESQKLALSSANICQEKTRSLVTNAKRTKSPTKQMDEMTKYLKTGKTTIRNQKSPGSHDSISTKDDEDNRKKESSEDENDKHERAEEKNYEEDELEINEKRNSDEEDQLLVDEQENSNEKENSEINEKESDNEEDDLEINGRKKDNFKRSDRMEDATAVKLIGQYPTEPMVELRNGVKCVRKVLDTALEVSKEGTHLARRLIDGVFTVQHLLRVTYSGQPPHAQGRERMNEQVECLDREGKQAIKDYVVEWCREKNKKTPTEVDFKRAMSQRIGEIKRRERENKKFNQKNEDD